MTARLFGQSPSRQEGEGNLPNENLELVDNELLEDLHSEGKKPCRAPELRSGFSFGRYRLATKIVAATSTCRFTIG